MLHNYTSYMKYPKQSNSQKQKLNGSCQRQGWNCLMDIEFLVLQEEKVLECTLCMVVVVV